MQARVSVRQHVVAFAALTVLFALISVLGVIVLRGENQRNALLMEYRAERSASALYEMVVEGRAAELDLEAGDVLAFGIYSETGLPLYRGGAAPAVFPRIARGAESVFSYDVARRVVTLARRSGSVPPSRFGHMPRMPARMSGSQYLYLEMDVGALAAREGLYRVGMVAVPLLIGLLMAFVGFLYFKNADYRRRMAVQEARQEHLASLGETARTLAHELKNPLNAIKLRARMAQRQADPESVEDLRVIEEEVQRLSQLTLRIGQFLKDPVGRPEAIGVGPFVADVLDRNGWPVTLDDHCPEAAITVDPDRLRSVVENVVRNAIDSGGGRPDGVEVVISCERGRVQIAVLDRGVGLDPIDSDRVFDPFYTSKTTGSGIGLSMARRFVEAAGGTIELRSRLGGGAEARLKFPRSRA